MTKVRLMVFDSFLLIILLAVIFLQPGNGLDFFKGLSLPLVIGGIFFNWRYFRKAKKA
ncbi:MAG: hypothetical protein ACYCOO_02365 [Chitinophagaceae bacterium]